MTLHTIGNVGAVTLTDEQRTYYGLQLLKRLEPLLTYYQFGMQEDIPKGGGTKINKRRFEKLTVSSSPTALTEGLSPVPDEISISKVEITPAQYGSFLRFTDKAILQSIDDLTAEFIQLEKEKARETADIVIRNPLMLGTQVIYAGGVASRDVLSTSSKLSVADLRKASTMLMRKNCSGFSDGSFVCITHPDNLHDLKLDSGWTDYIKYKTPEYFFNGEVGKIDNIRFVATTQAPILFGAGSSTCTGLRSTSSKADVYQSVILSPEAYMCISMSGKSGNVPEVYSQLPTSSITDPLAQVGYAGFKFWQGAGIVDNLRLVRIESVASGW